MSNQPQGLSLFDPIESVTIRYDTASLAASKTVTLRMLGAKKRDAGLSSAASHWCAGAVRRELGYLVDEMATWTTDDLWARFSPTLKDAVMMSPNVIPAMVTELAKANKIVQAGTYIRTNRPEGRKRRIAQWRKA